MGRETLESREFGSSSVHYIENLQKGDLWVKSMTTLFLPVQASFLDVKMFIHLEKKVVKTDLLILITLWLCLGIYRRVPIYIFYVVG